MFKYYKTLMSLYKTMIKNICYFKLKFNLYNKYKNEIKENN